MKRCLVATLLVACLPSCKDARPVAEIVLAIEQATPVARQQLVPELRAHEDAVSGWVRLLAVKKSDYNLHVLAASELGSLGAEAASAVPELVRFLREGFPGMDPGDMTVAERVRTPDAGRRPAREALRSIGEPSIDPVADLLSHQSGRTRQEAALTLGQIGPPAARSLPLLIRALGDADKAVAASAAWAIGEIRQASGEVKTALVAAFEDVDPLVRFEALRAVGKFGKEAAELRESVRKLAGDSDTGVRTIATEVLQRLPLPMSKEKDPPPADRKSK